MRVFRKRFVAWFLLITSWVIISACNTTKLTHSESAVLKVDALTEEAKALITDSERADRVVSLIAQIDDLIEESQSDLDAHKRKMRALLADFDTSSAVLQSQLDQFNEQRERRQKEVRRISDSIREATTEEEWDELKKDLRNTMSSLVKLAQQP